MFLFSAQKILRRQTVLGDLPADRDIFSNTVRMAWPSIMESFLVSLVGMVDTFMVSSLGLYAIAAVGLTTQPKFIGLAVFISLNVAVSAIVARRKGEGDRESANKVLMQALMIAGGLLLVVSTLCVVFADPILRLAGSQSDTHGPAVTYFRIVMGGMAFNVISMVINAAQRGAGNTRISLTTNLVSNLVNVVFDYLLIGGHFGFPALGVAGAAVATVIGSVCGCVMSILSMLHRDNFLCIREVKKIGFDRTTVRAITNIGSSTLAEQAFLRIGFMTFAIIVARLGTIPMAAHQIGMNLMSICFSFGDGLSVASVALVGQSLGMGRPDLARVYGNVCQRCGLLFACGLSVIFLTLGQRIFGLFSEDPAILSYGRMIMTVMMVEVFLQISQVVFSGCLRGAGDTVFTAVVSLISVLAVRPLMGWLLCYPARLGLFGAWLGLLSDQLVRFLMTYLRFRSGNWMNRKV